MLGGVGGGGYSWLESAAELSSIYSPNTRALQLCCQLPAGA